MKLGFSLKGGSLLAILVVAMLGVGLACGGDDADDATNTPAAATATTAPLYPPPTEPTATR